LLALLNPASKVLFLAAYKPQLSNRQNFELAWKSSAAALAILILLAYAGNLILKKVFHVELYSLQITGGIIVFLIGLSAIRDGKFIQKKNNELQSNFTEISLVPLAAPLIAGPGMIAAAIASGVELGLGPSIAALTMAILINFVFMLFANAINKFLTMTHLLGPLIRLTGLIIAAVAMQMIINGTATCVRDMLAR
jgi:multiple antibiotic resistance protein